MALQAVGEMDHTVGHELHVGLAGRQGGFLADAERDQAGHAAVGEPVVDTVAFLALDGGVVEEHEQHVEGVEHDPPGAHLMRFGLEAGEHALQVEPPALDCVQRHACVEEEELLVL